MTISKRTLMPERLRAVPAHFSWLDHRLVQEHYIERAEVDAWALYLFLVTVADQHGVSYYADASLARRLRLDPPRLQRARAALLRLDLVAYEPPLYQVLSLPEVVPVAVRCARLRAVLEHRS
jgi:hypothetical protein